MHQDGSLFLVLLVNARRIEFDKGVKGLMVAVFGGEHDRCLAFAIGDGGLRLGLYVGEDGLEDVHLLGANGQVDGRSVLFNIRATEKGLGSRL